MSSVLLLSGGMDSSALAHWLRPDGLLFVDYGQRSAEAERRAASRVASDLDQKLGELALDCSKIGEDILRGSHLPEKPASEQWWPFRNQLLATFASAWALGNGLDEVLFGTVSGDGAVHRDGTPWFVSSIDAIISGQEGGIRVRTPAIDRTTEELIELSGISLRALAATYSCHSGSLPCGDCGGCIKRDSILREILNVAR